MALAAIRPVKQQFRRRRACNRKRRTGDGLMPASRTWVVGNQPFFTPLALCECVGRMDIMGRKAERAPRKINAQIPAKHLAELH